MTVVLWILLALLALIVFVLAVPFGAHVAYIGGELAVDARVMGINIGIRTGTGKNTGAAHGSPHIGKLTGA